MSVEKRINPDDGMAYSWEELDAFYRGTFTRKQIEAYWAQCAPAKKETYAKIKRRTSDEAGKKSSVSAKKAVEETPQISVDQELAAMAAKANEVYKQLPSQGKQLWKLLKTCIQNTLGGGVVHFERALRDELQDHFDEMWDLKRQSGSQWVVSVTEGPRQATHHVSVRSEVLAGGKVGSGGGLLAKLKHAARSVKNVLLQDGASWLRELADPEACSEDQEGFLEEVLDHMENDEAAYGTDRRLQDRSSNDESGDICPICKKSVKLDRLGGKHMCKIIVTFRCCSKWTSHAGRYNPEEKRVMGQRCQRCNAMGVAASDWKLAKDSMVGDVEKPHRSELCESCDLYGNCRASFSDPFQMTMAIRAHTQEAVVWRGHSSGNLWMTTVGDQMVVLQPHVHTSSW